MTDWEGWSPDPAQVERTRVLGGLLASVTSAGSTSVTVDEVVAQLGSTLDVGHFFRRVLAGPGHAADLGLFEPELSIAPNADPLQLTAVGERVAAEFRGAQRPLMRRRGARRALVLWLDQDTAPYTDYVIRDLPEGWF